MSRFRPSIASSLYSDDDHDNVFATAASTQTSFQNVNDIIHSTPQQQHQHNTDDARPFPLHYDQHPEVDDQDTQGSAEMSIELGRGVKRGAQQQDDDLSSNAIFGFGNDNSQYEIADTPPARPRNSHRKSDGTLRKEASIRRATESARANDATKRTATGARRAVSESQAKTGSNAEALHETATATVMGSRFAQRVSSSYKIPTRYATTEGLGSNHSTPRRQAAGNATVQSATYTANQSFMLPDLSNIVEIVSGGARLNGTPLRRTATANTRFVSASYRGDSQTQSHLPVNALVLPEDEKAIFASLQMLHDRVNQLELEKSEAQKHLESYEQEVIELRSQLQIVTDRADSGLGSEEETADVRLSGTQRTKLEAKVRASEERLERSERKASVSNINVTRITKERDVLLSQLASAYVKNEELENENDVFRKTVGDLRSENEDLRARVQELDQENIQMRTKITSLSKSRTAEKEGANPEPSSSRMNDKTDDISEGIQVRGTANKRHGKSQVYAEEDHEREDRINESILRDLASRTEREAQRQREAVSDRSQARVHRTRSRSRSQRRTSLKETEDYSTRLRRHVSVPLELEQTGSSLADDDRTQKSSRTAKLTQQFEDDLTVLSDLDHLDVARLRRKLEEELQNRHTRKTVHARAQSANDLTTNSTHRSLSRKPSLKDTTAGTGRLDLGDDSLDDILKVTKSVRVQSPHTSDEISHSGDQSLDVGQISSLSNTSRRRRRATSADGQTSAFIIPDIELHTTTSLSSGLGNKCIQHNARQCTACEHEDTQVEIPMPVPVTEREEVVDLTNATIRPSQSPAEALAKVIKNLEDEIKHLKLKRDGHNRIYNQHDPALGRRKRISVKALIDALTAEVERKSDQVYALYDVLEGQKDLSSKVHGTRRASEMTEGDVEETLQSLGIDPIELSGRVARKAPVGLNDDLSDDSELPFEGFSEMDSEDEHRKGFRA